MKVMGWDCSKSKGNKYQRKDYKHENILREKEKNNLNKKHYEKNGEEILLGPFSEWSSRAVHERRVLTS